MEVDLGARIVPGAVNTGRLENPPRIYFDLAYKGTRAPRPVTLGTPEIRRVRFGIHRSPNGIVLRHVLDLQDNDVEVTSVHLVDGKLVIEARRRR